MSFLDQCREIISIDSSTSAGTAEVGQWISQFATKNGLIVEEFVESFNGLEQRNLIISLNGKSENSDFILQAHLDTGDAGPISFWIREGYLPFEATIKDGKIFGLGAAGVKLDLFCKLLAMINFSQKGPTANNALKTSPKLVLTYGEESGMHGMLRLIRKGKIKAKWALVSEPTEVNFSYAGKGFAVVEIDIPYSEHEIEYRLDQETKESISTQSKIFVGKSALSSDPSLGDSAILKMLNYLENLPEGVSILNIDGGVGYNSVPSDAMIEFDLVADLKDSMQNKILKVYSSIKKLEVEFQKYSDPEFEIANPTLTIGMIRTTDEGVRIIGSCRIPPTVTDEVYQKWMVELQTSCASVGAQSKVTDYKRPYRISKESQFLKTCLEVAKSYFPEAKVVTQGNTNEASLLARTGVECISFGPGKCEGNVHTPHEHVTISDLEKSVDFYGELIQRVCL